MTSTDKSIMIFRKQQITHIEFKHWNHVNEIQCFRSVNEQADDFTFNYSKLELEDE